MIACAKSCVVDLALLNLAITNQDTYAKCFQLYKKSEKVDLELRDLELREINLELRVINWSYVK